MFQGTVRKGQRNRGGKQNNHFHCGAANLRGTCRVQCLQSIIFVPLPSERQSLQPSLKCSLPLLLPRMNGALSARLGAKKGCDVNMHNQRSVMWWSEEGLSSDGTLLCEHLVSVHFAHQLGFSYIEN